MREITKCLLTWFSKIPVDVSYKLWPIDTKADLVLVPPPPPKSHNRPIPIYLNSCLASRLGGIKQKKSSWGSVMNDTFFVWNKFTKASIFVSVCCWGIECFHSRGQHLCKCFGTKENICIRKEFISHRTSLGHKHGRRFIVLGHQYGRRDVMWKHSI